MIVNIPSLSGILASRWGRIAVPAAAVLLVGLLIVFWRGRDARAIHRRLDELRELVSKDGEEKPLAQLAQTREVIEYFTPDAPIIVGSPLPALQGRQEIAALFHQARAVFRTIDVKIRDRALQIAADKLGATMDMTAEVVAEGLGETVREVREIRTNWVKQDGDWLISEVSNVETIRKPQPATTP